MLIDRYDSLRGAFSAISLFTGSRVLVFCCGIWIGLSACDASSPSAVPLSGAFEQRVAATDADQGTLKQRQAAFLLRIRKADPEHRTIERAVFNDRNDLGLILNHSVELDKIPALMRSMLTPMARAFPGQDLTILAYSPSNPPRKIGTAQLNARTRDMTYTPAQRGS
jgi:hypothetical protein